MYTIIKYYVYVPICRLSTNMCFLNCSGETKNCFDSRSFERWYRYPAEQLLILKRVGKLCLSEKLFLSKPMASDLDSLIYTL